MFGAFGSAWLRELNHLRESPWDFFITIVFPALLLVAVGVLFLGGTPRELPLLLVDQDHSTVSRDLASRLDAAPGIRVLGSADTLTDAFSRIKSRQAYGVFYIPKNTERDIKASRHANIVLYTAATYYTASLTLEREAGAVVTATGAGLMKDEVAHSAPRRVKPPPVDVQVTTLFNAGPSYELMIVSVLMPVIIVIALSCAVVSGVGREISRREFANWIGETRMIVPAVLGKLTPYLVLYFVLGVVCTTWLAAHGYPIAGSYPVLLSGYALMLFAYALVGTFTVLCVRDTTMALGAVAVYASSALTYSGAFFPMRGGVLFTEAWSAIQPFTWYTVLSAQQWQMGVPVFFSRQALLILGLMVAVMAAVTYLALRLAWRDAKAGAL